MTLSTKQVKAIPVILAAKTEGEGCKLAGVAVSTFWEWRKLPEFLEEFERQKNDLSVTAYDLLEKSLRQAVERLRKLMDSKNEKVALDASKFVVETRLRIDEIERILHDLESLQQCVDEMTGRQPRRALLSGT